jgi:adenylosuccinate lyase
MTDNGLDSPFAARYGSPEMRAVWSDANKRALWRQIWLALAEAQAAAGVVSEAQLEDVRSHAGKPNTKRALAIEQEIGHDVMAELRAFAEQCPAGGGILHWGATSADITDNADILRQRQALRLLRERLAGLLRALADKIDAYKSLATMAYTHLQPAEPTTVGYRLAVYGQDLLENLATLDRFTANLRGKGLKGAVGTAASYQELLAGSETPASQLEADFLERLSLRAFPITAQTYPRGQDYSLLAALASIGAALHKLGFDLRLLQSQGIGEWAEPFGEKQVGSSAMPFKRNPVNAEKMCSLARLVAALPAVAWENAAESLLERTLDDSANRRVILPEAFLAIEECLITAERIMTGLHVDAAAAAANLEKFGPFAATERVLMALVRAGGDRQRAHERLREHSLKAWAAIKAGRPNPLGASLAGDPEFLVHLQPARLRELMDARAYVGSAVERAAALADAIRAALVAEPAAA